ncbi:LysR substrate-binding domain-containing protein [Streptomyces sp. JV185]|uniref:LysR substrate-binding domain-containing protein n=1 Tax=Streptomyces sp. JV185 TaxID=858638 RepID=UPI003FA6E577
MAGDRRTPPDQGSRRRAVRGLPRGHRAGGRGRRLTAHCGLERRITCDVTRIRLLVGLVRAGTGVAIVPRRTGEDAGLPCVSIRRPEPGRTVVLAARAPGPGNPAAEALLGRLTAPTDAAPAAAGRPGGRRPPAG